LVFLSRLVQVEKFNCENHVVSQWQASPDEVHVLIRYQGTKFVLGILVAQLHTADKTLKENKRVNKGTYQVYHKVKGARSWFGHGLA